MLSWSVHKRRWIHQQGPCQSETVRERCVNSRPSTHTPTGLPAATQRAPQENQIKNDNHRVCRLPLQEMQVSLLKDAHATKASNYLQLFCQLLAWHSSLTILSQSAPCFEKFWETLYILERLRHTFVLLKTSLLKYSMLFCMISWFSTGLRTWAILLNIHLDVTHFLIMPDDIF